MRTFIRLTLFVVLLPALAGCFTSETLIKLNADGSGTLENVVLVNESAMDEMAGMFGGKAGQGTTNKGMQEMTFDEATLRAEAEKLGRGVRFVSSEPLTRGSFKGARVIYAFDDVNALTVDQDPLGSATGAKASSVSTSTSTKEPLAMRLTRLPNGNTLLTIDLKEESATKPAAKKSTAPKMGKDGMPAEMQAMIREMFDGFRVAINVEVNGTLVRTSSPHATGSRVAVLEMDMGQLMRDEANMKRLMDVEPGAGLAEMMPLLKDVKGIKINESPLTIEFAAR